jgi:hypothetical protein
MFSASKTASADTEAHGRAVSERMQQVEPSLGNWNACSECRRDPRRNNFV